MAEREPRQGGGEATVPVSSLTPIGTGPSGYYLLVVERASSRLLPLPAVGSLLIGRGVEADVRLDDPEISRRHARLELDEAGVRLIDLGSRNGVTVNGAAVAGQRQLAAGDLVGVAEVTLVLRGGPPARRPRAVLEARELAVRLEQELARALHYGRPLSVAVLSAADGAGASASSPELVRALERRIRPLDVVGRGEGGVVVVILPELDAAQAEAVAASLLEVPGGERARVGVATFPGAGCDPSTLLAAAREAAMAGGAGRVAGDVERVTTLTLGERTIVLADAAMVRLYALIARLAAADLPVLVVGETGAGKEHAAFAVHHGSRRRAAPYLAVNCAAIPDTLVESELFGYDKGAFSGATTAKAGVFERAHGGTLFLDEVGELSLVAQAKLLRVLEGGRYTRLGDAREREVDVRVVAATNRDLLAEVRAKRFREDLYYRLASAVVLIPPLRDRPADVLLLAQRFLAAARSRVGLPPLTLSPAATLALTRHAWPGNVRELRNAMDYVAAAVPDGVVAREALPASLTAAVDAPPSEVEAASTAAAGAGEPGAGAPVVFRPLAEEIAALERQRIVQALEAAGGVKLRAAALIAMPERTFRLKLRQYGLGRTDR